MSTSCTIIDSAAGYAGAVFLGGGTLIISDSSVTRAHAETTGGFAHLRSGELRLERVTVERDGESGEEARTKLEYPRTLTDEYYLLGDGSVQSKGMAHVYR